MLPEFAVIPIMNPDPMTIYAEAFNYYFSLPVWAAAVSTVFILAFRWLSRT